MMQNTFATQIFASIDHNLTANNVYTIIEPEPCKVVGYTISTAFAPLPLAITIASADGLTIYRQYLMSGTVPTHIVENIPFIADKGLAWKSVFASVPQFAVLIYSTFFLTQHGS
jgi:hypothetical protein